jgi:hypothetical protein
MNIYEIYTKHPETGEGGWTIEFIEAPDRETVATYPLFDCVITVNDYPCIHEGRPNIKRFGVWNEPANLTECRQHPVYNRIWEALEILHDADSRIDAMDRAQANIHLALSSKQAHIAQQAIADYKK